MGKKRKRRRKENPTSWQIISRKNLPSKAKKGFNPTQKTPEGREFIDESGWQTLIDGEQPFVNPFKNLLLMSRGRMIIYIKSREEPFIGKKGGITVYESIKVVTL